VRRLLEGMQLENKKQSTISAYFSAQKQEGCERKCIATRLIV
jgi:hypothetical protein